MKRRCKSASPSASVPPLAPRFASCCYSKYQIVAHIDRYNEDKVEMRVFELLRDIIAEFSRDSVSPRFVTQMGEFRHALDGFEHCEQMRKLLAHLVRNSG
jgi:hypothetical protein